MTKSIKVLTTPGLSENQYTENVSNIITSIENVELTYIENINFKTLLSGYKAYDVAVINWLENLVVSKTKRISFVGVIKLFIKLFILKAISKRTIYVRHNIYPHALSDSSALIAKHCTNICMSLCDYGVVHSGHLAQGNIHYIPHPLYNVEPANLTSIDSRYYIVFGRIAEYKKIDVLLDCWRGEPLIIAGKVDSQSYLLKLSNIIEEQSACNIQIVGRFLSDDHAATYVSKSKGLIITHYDKDMIVSGSFFFAISLGVPVHAIETPFFRWLKTEYDFYGLTLYSDVPSLAKSLNIAEEKPFKRELIMSTAREVFGGEKIKKSWTALIKECGK